SENTPSAGIEQWIVLERQDGLGRRIQRATARRQNIATGYQNLAQALMVRCGAGGSRIIARDRSGSAVNSKGEARFAGSRLRGLRHQSAFTELLYRDDMRQLAEIRSARPQMTIRQGLRVVFVGLGTS